MKVALFFLAGLCAVALASPTPQDDRMKKVADKAFLAKQKDMLRLYKHVNQESYYKDHIDIAKSWQIKDNVNAYTKPEVAKYFWTIYKQGMLPRGHVFSIFYDQHMKEAIALFKLFYYAKDYETFYKTAVWARQNMNEGMYVYALSVAIVHREDTYGIVLPPIYEVYPYYFFNSEVIDKMHQYKQKFSGDYKGVDATPKGYVIPANYSGWYLNLHPEQALSYYTEDVGMNAYYYYFNIYYPFWMTNEEFYYKNERRGEQYYYVHQQILARFYMERLSNDYDQINHFDYDYPIETGFYPSLRYHNGLEFPARPSNAHLFKNFNNGEQSFHYFNFTYTYTNIEDYERRIRDAIDRGIIFTADGKQYNLYEPEGFEILGNLIESNPQSLNTRFFGPLQINARRYLGYSNYPLDQYKAAPSAMEHFETSMRDPVFYQFYKRIVMYFQKYKTHLPHYKYNDLYFPGMKVEDVEIDKFVTFFNMFDSDISNAAYVTEKEFETDSFKAYARQYRLDHKPFTYKIHVTSDKAIDGVVRVFMGPKNDNYGRTIDINENRMNFVEFDKFHYKFQAGKNTITRNSQDNHYVSDRTTYQQLYQRVLSALEGKEEYILDGAESFYGFPNRFTLPIGRKEGLKYQFYVIVSPYKPYKTDNKEYYPVSTGYQQFMDAYPLGYPFDRHISEHDFYVANSFFKDVLVYHKGEDEINKTFKLGDYN